MASPLLLASLCLPLLLAVSGAQAAEGSSDTRLERSSFRAAVLAANPGLEAAQAAADAARASSRAAGAWRDPVLSLATTPLAYAPGGMTPGASVGVAQALPIGGERWARMDMAAAVVEHRTADLEQARLDLALAADLAWDAWYGVGAALAVNARHAGIVDELQAAATAAYAAGMAAADAPLEAALQRARLDQERAWLEAGQDAARAELNRLLHRAPDEPLPPAAALESWEPTPAPAFGTHPTLRAAEAREDTAQAVLGMARADRWPMVGAMVSYSSMWDAPEHRLMAGVELGLPAWGGTRQAAVDAAQAGLQQADREREAVLDGLRATDAVCRARLDAARRGVEIQEQRVLPLAQERLAVLQAGLATGVTELRDLLRAERDLLDAELALENARVAVLDARSALDHARGALPEGETP